MTTEARPSADMVGRLYLSPDEMRELWRRVDRLTAERDALQKERDSANWRLANASAMLRDVQAQRDALKHDAEAADSYIRFADAECAKAEQERDALLLDARRWRFVAKHPNYQGSCNGYATFKQAIDAALHSRR